MCVCQLDVCVEVRVSVLCVYIYVRCVCVRCGCVYALWVCVCALCLCVRCALCVGVCAWEIRWDGFHDIQLG